MSVALTPHVRSVIVAKPTRVLTLNDRMHHMQRAELVRVWRAAAYWWAKQHRLRCWDAVGKVQFGLELGVSRKVRRDPHNWFPTVKAICDGFTDAQVWPDDSEQYVTTLEPRFVTDIRPDSIRITLTWETL